MNKQPNFCATRWTLVRHAGAPDHPRAKEALEELLKLYWYPIYAYIRRRGSNHDDAQDLVQAFLGYACEHRTLAKADETKGRFRTFVLVCLDRFLSDEYRNRNAIKRGGRTQFVSRDDDALTTEERYRAEPVDDLSPARLFERKLAQEILDSTMRELEAEAAAGGKAEIFAALRGYIGQDDTIEGYRALSARLNLSVSDLKSKALRFRRRYREIILEHARDLVDSESDVKPEIIVLEDSL